MSLKLEYGFNSNPYPIRASVEGAANTIDLSVMISQRDDAVALQSIEIEIPMGGALNDDFALSTAKDLPQPVYDQRSLWNITTSGGSVTIVPRNGSSAELTTPIEFILPGITVNNAKGFVAIRITEVAPVRISDEFAYRLEKLEADFPVTRFYVTDPVLDDLDLTTTLYWECSTEGQNYSYRLHTADVSADQGYGWMPKECLISGDCYSCNDGKSGVQTPQLGDDTTFALDVIKADSTGARVVHKTLFVTVRVQVPYFSPAARLVRVPNRFVVLRWRAFNASRVTVRLNDDIVDANAPVDPYLNGYNVPLSGAATRAHFHLTAHARAGDAVAYYAAFPDLTLQQPVQVTIKSRSDNDSNPFGIPYEPPPLAANSAAAAASANFAVAGCADEGLRLIDLNLRTARTFPWTTEVDALCAVAITPDGKQIIGGGVQSVKGFDASNGNQLWALGNNCDGMVMAASGRVLLITYANFMGVIDMANPGAGAKPIANSYPGYPPGMAGKCLTTAITADGTLAILGMMGGYVYPLPTYLTVLNVSQRQADPKTISLAGYYVSQVAVSPNGKVALATVYKDGVTGALMFIDVPNRTVTDTIALGQSTSPPNGALVLGNSYAFILVSSDNVKQTVLVVDLAQKKVVTTLDVGTGATALALGPDNSSLIVANSTGVLII